MMPQTTVSLPATAGVEPHGSDRRIAPRYPSALDAACQPVMARDGSPWAGQVVNISRGGIGLVLDRRFEPKTLLVIDLESPQENVSRTLLARVVHSTRRDTGWLLGCAFISELDEDDLKLFRARRLRPAGTDCRAWVRFSCDLETSCAPDGSDEAWPARVMNVAPGGIGLVVPGEVPVGSILRVEMPRGQTGVPRHVLVRVVQTTRQSAQSWLLGCEFTEQLSDEELQALCSE